MIGKQGFQKGIDNPSFGKIKDKPGYSALHCYIKKRLIKPEKCEHCGLEKKLELSSKNHSYIRDIKDWWWICKKCHFNYDGAKKYLDLGRTGPGKRYTKKCLNCNNIIKNITPCNLERKKYCSRRCGMLYMQKNKIIDLKYKKLSKEHIEKLRTSHLHGGIYKKCFTCKKLVLISPSRQKNKKSFCSKICYTNYQLRKNLIK